MHGKLYLKKRIVKNIFRKLRKDTEYFTQMRYNVYTSAFHNRISMNWIGEYTFGSISWRGIHIHLTKKGGIGLGYKDDLVNTVHSLKLEENFMFWDDDVIWILSMDEFTDLTHDFREVSFDDVKHMVDNTNCDEWDYEGACSDVFSNNNQEGRDMIKKDFLANLDSIQNATRIVTHIGTRIYILYDHVSLYNELEEVKKIADGKGISFDY